MGRTGPSQWLRAENESCSGRPETAEVVGDGVVGEVLGGDHELAAAETRRVVRHPRHRLTRLHLNVAVPLQPVVRSVHQLPASQTNQTVQRGEGLGDLQSNEGYDVVRAFHF